MIVSCISFKRCKVLHFKFRSLSKFFLLLCKVGVCLTFQDEQPVGPSPFNECVIIFLLLSNNNFPVQCGSLSGSSTLTSLSLCLCYQLESHKCYNFLQSLDISQGNCSLLFFKITLFFLAFTFPSELACHVNEKEKLVDFL